MSPLVVLARRVNVRASRYWLVLLYIAVVVTLILAFAIEELARRLT